MLGDVFSIAWPFFAASVLAFELAIHAWTKRRNKYTTYFMLVMFCAAFWSLLSGTHLMVPAFELKAFLSDFKFIFIVSIPVLWFLMAAHYAQRPPSRRATLALFAIPVITLSLIATGNDLVFTETLPLDGDGFVTVTREYGAWFWVHTAYSYSLMGAGVLLFLGNLFQTRGHIRAQGIVMLAGSLTPVFFNVIYLSNPDSFYQLDLTPVSFAVSGVVFFFGLYKYRMLELVPIARELILEAMDDGVVVTDPEGFIVQSNDAMKRLLESPDDKIVGQSVAEVFPFLRETWEAYEGPGTSKAEIPYMYHGEQIWLTVRMQLVQDHADSTHGRLILLRDITERKVAELKTQESMERIDELSRLKSAFLSNMSHDVRTPLSGIIGLADVLLEETEGDQFELVEMIRTSGDRLLKLLNSILSVAHLSSGTLDQNTEKTDVVVLAQKILAQFEREAESKAVDLRASIPSESLYLVLDPNHLAHALTHLLDQSIRFTDSGSIQFDLRKELTDVVIRVSDTGKGFVPEFVESINQPLDTLTLAEFGLDKGSSLGLRVAHGMIQEIGGELDIQSEPGKGSVFTIRLPQTVTNATPDRAANPRSVDPHRPASPSQPSDRR